MTLPSSGLMTAAMINAELGRSATASFFINGAAERALAERPSGTIAFSDFYGKSDSLLKSTITIGRYHRNVHRGNNLTNQGDGGYYTPKGSNAVWVYGFFKIRASGMLTSPPAYGGVTADGGSIANPWIKGVGTVVQLQESYTQYSDGWVGSTTHPASNIPANGAVFQTDVNTPFTWSTLQVGARVTTRTGYGRANSGGFMVRAGGWWWSTGNPASGYHNDLSTGYPLGRLRSGTHVLIIKE